MVLILDKLDYFRTACTEYKLKRNIMFKLVVLVLLYICEGTYSYIKGRFPNYRSFILFSVKYERKMSGCVKGILFNSPL